VKECRAHATPQGEKVKVTMNERSDLEKTRGAGSWGFSGSGLTGEKRIGRGGLPCGETEIGLLKRGAPDQLIGRYGGEKGRLSSILFLHWGGNIFRDGGEKKQMQTENKPLGQRRRQESFVRQGVLGESENSTREEKKKSR